MRSYWRGSLALASHEGCPSLGWLDFWQCVKEGRASGDRSLGSYSVVLWHTNSRHAIFSISNGRQKSNIAIPSGVE